jgi:PPOX class probable FMN-dependent enzyme
MTDDARPLESIEQVRSIIGEPGPATALKVADSLDAMSIDFIRRAPFLMLATATRDGLPDVSPKGDEPGFVAVLDPKTLLIPDRKGNRLIFSLQNIVANPQISVIFVIPGTEETLRVQGRASLTADPAILERLSARGQPALLAIRLAVDKCYFHCAKAFKRSRLWQSESWPERKRISFGKQMAPRLGGDDKLAAHIDELIEADYKENL